MSSKESHVYHEENCGSNDLHVSILHVDFTRKDLQTYYFRTKKNLKILAKHRHTMIIQSCDLSVTIHHCV